MSNYHPDPKVNRNCQRIIEKLHERPATLNELSKLLNMPGYDVTVAVSALSAKDHIIRARVTRWEFLSF